MKRLVLWLAKIFKVELPQKTEVKTVEVIVEKNFYDGDVVNGDLEVRGNLTVKGVCIVDGELKAWGK